jgi:signal peptidase II
MLMLAAVIVLLDRFSKSWVMTHFRPGDSRALTRFFSLTYIQNTGMAFGLLQGRNHALLMATFIILSILFYSARGLSERGGWPGFIGIALVIGGAIGNIIDRMRFDRVIDFLDFHFWPVFNLADSAITVGAAFIFLGVWLGNRRKVER